MTGVLHPARVRRPSNEWLPASDDRNRAHRVACRPYASEHGKVQHECRLNYILMSKQGHSFLPVPKSEFEFAHAMKYGCHVLVGSAERRRVVSLLHRLQLLLGKIECLVKLCSIV